MKVCASSKELAQAEPDVGRRSLAACAKVLADKAGRLEGWRHLLEDWDMQESVVAREWRDLGKAEGKVEGMREAILEILQARFPPGVPANLTALIRGTTDPSLLSIWTRKAVTSPSLEEFQRELEAQSR